MRGTALRWIAVLAVGVALLAVVLYFASTVDGRPPQVAEVRLTQALSTDARVAVTTSSVEVVFSEPVDHRQAEAAFSIEPDVDGAFSWSGSVMVFTPVDPLPLETEFTINVGSDYRISESCRVRTTGSSVRINCHNVRVLEGKGSYSPDSFDLRLSNARVIRGNVSDSNARVPVTFTRS